MGVDLSEFKYLFFSFLPLFLKDYVQTLIASGVIFGVLGLLISTAFGRENKDQKDKRMYFNKIQKVNLLKKKIQFSQKYQITKIEFSKLNHKLCYRNKLR